MPAAGVPAATSRHFRLRAVGLALIGCAVVSLQFGVADVVGLRSQGFSVGAQELIWIAGGHVLLGLAMSVAIAALVVPLGRARRAEWLSPRGAGWVSAITQAGLGVLYVNAWLPGLIDPRNPVHWTFNLGALASGGLVLGAWELAMLSRVARTVLILALVSLDGAVALAPVWSTLVRQDASLQPRGKDRVRPAADGSRQRGPDVFVVLMDTMRADHLGVYGYVRHTSPQIDQFAAGAAVFDRAYSASNWTRPAVASLHTSTLPARHGVVDHGHALPPTLTLLAQTLKAEGYHTGFFTVGANVEPADGYGRGMDRFYFAATKAGLMRTTLFGDVISGLAPGRIWRLVGPNLMARLKGLDPSDPEAISAQTLEWVRSVPRTEPVFAYIHYMGPHDPYSPPARFATAFTPRGIVPRLAHPPVVPGQFAPDALSERDREQMLAQYDAEILWHDTEFGVLLDELRREGRLDQAIVVVMADHGEAFGEHGLWGHSAGLYDEIVRIPLILWQSKEAGWRGRRLAMPVSLIDVAPTLLDLVGVRPPMSFSGESLVPWLEGNSESRVVLMENPPRGELGMRSERWSYWEERRSVVRRWLYRSEDVDQLQELSTEEAGEASKLSAEMMELARRYALGATSAPAIELDEARRERLRALGYLR